jgi:hypothetical protein
MSEIESENWIETESHNIADLRRLLAPGKTVFIYARV